MAPKSQKPTIGISACLLGQPVRYNGNDKRDDFIVDKLGKYFDWLSVCPEVEMGLGVPRESMRLISRRGEIALVTTKGLDHTSGMREYARKKVRTLARANLRGFLLKKNSPSCGMEKVKVYDENGSPFNSGEGLFAAELKANFPNLPIEEEGRLANPKFRENWIERVFAYDRLQAFWRTPWRTGGLVDFHTRHKLTLLAHSPEDYRRLGRLVAGAKGRDREKLRAEYESEFMGAMKKIATPGKHANVLYHVIGWFKKTVDASDRRELQGHIEDYQAGSVPLVVPLTMIIHYIRRHKIDYLLEQSYLDPHPKELALRSQI